MGTLDFRKSKKMSSNEKRKTEDHDLDELFRKRMKATATVAAAAPVKYETTKSQPSQILLNNMKFMEQMANSRPEPVRDSDIRQAAEATSSTNAIKQVQKIQQQSKLPGPKKQPVKYIRSAGGDTWEDPTLLEWDPNDYRIFVGDIGNECTDDLLTKAFNKYPSFQKAKVLRDKITLKTKGYGFVSFKDPKDFVQAMREMNGKYIGNKPCKLRKSTWDKKNDSKKIKKAQKQHIYKQKKAA